MSRRLYAVLFALIAAGVTAACASTALEPTEGDGSDRPGIGSGASAGESGAAGGAEAEADCTLGTERCDCRPDGSCDANLTCLSELCVDARALCPYPGDGVCDEPFPCPAGSDPDCCAVVQDGVCEELSMGGLCADGSDNYDCGYCPAEWVGDTVCDEPGLCPPGTDAVDCCAHPTDGVCEEAGMGGDCPVGSDWYDCGYCPPDWVGDGLCDAPDFCPEGTDAADCCAHPTDGVCEETGMGGECPAGSDWYDCGYCPPDWIADGICDEVQQGGWCPSNSDVEDCCATWDDAVCEEPSADGACPTQSDYLDCGYCPEQWVDDGICDETRVGGPCPDGSDGEDCCATLRDGNCEEETCGELTDWYDCGYCPEPWLGDGYCHETVQVWACPAGSDPTDCSP